MTPTKSTFTKLGVSLKSNPAFYLDSHKTYFGKKRQQTCTFIQALFCYNRIHIVGY